MMTRFTTKCPLNLDFMVKVGDKFHNVVFTIPMVYGTPQPSTYTTYNKEVAEALKKHRDFGVAFFIDEESDADEQNSSKVTATKAIEDDLKDPSTAVYDDTVTTKGMAVAYIQGNYDGVFTSSSVEDMKREAARKWNVVFTKWGK